MARKIGKRAKGAPRKPRAGTKKAGAQRASVKKASAKASHAKAPRRSVAKPKPKAPVQSHLDGFIDAAAHALGLPLRPEWRPAVRFNLEVTLRQAALVTDFHLPDEAEPAPVFRA
jgi:hypothetical protein